MTKIKVLHILHSFGIGGMEKGIAMLINHASAEFTHEILCLTQSGDSRHLLPPGIPIHEMHKSPGNSFRFIWDLARTIRHINPDVVHTRNWGGMDGIIAARLAGFSGIVHGEHGWGMEDPQGTNRKRILIRRILSLGVQEFVGVSKQIKDWLERTVKVKKPVNQVYNGVDFDRYPARDGQGSLRCELGLAATAPLVGVVGRLDPIKDHAGLIQAFGLLRKPFPDSHLVIVGHGPEEHRLRELNAENVHLLGLRKDIPEILRAIDVFALASLNEGISNTLLEAMACGLPVVSTAVGGTPELIRHGENGFLVEARDYKGFADFLARYINSDALRFRHGVKNRQIINTRFTTEAMVKGYEKIWSRVAGV
jgi:sugar transferase (PEP-CTERM/EpsH1 system associated)